MWQGNWSKFDIVDKKNLRFINQLMIRNDLSPKKLDLISTESGYSTERGYLVHQAFTSLMQQ